MSNITRRQERGVERHAPTENSLAEVSGFAEVFGDSGLFQDTKSMAQAIVKIQAGKEIGIPPVQAMMGINIMQNRISLSAGLIGQLLKKAGYQYKATWYPNQQNAESVTISLWEPGAKWREVEPLAEVSFSMEDARRAGLAKKDVWRKYPPNMLFARAISNAARWHAPEVLCGAYTPEELGGEPDAQDLQQYNQVHPTQTAAPTPQGMSVVEIVPQADNGMHPGPSWQKQNRRLRAIASSHNVSIDELKAVTRFYGKESSTELSATLLGSVADDIEHGSLKADMEFESYWRQAFDSGSVGADDYNTPRSAAKSVWQAIAVQRLINQHQMAQACAPYTHIPKPYRPSNGTEGEFFMAQFCYRCSKHDTEGGCPIQFATMSYEITDAEYPKEWIYDADGKETCTAFESKESKA
jgi:hypothetical protein